MRSVLVLRELRGAFDLPRYIAEQMVSSFLVSRISRALLGRIDRLELIDCKSSRTLGGLYDGIDNGIVHPGPSATFPKTLLPIRVPALSDARCGLR
jgi:hypothetical protein